jgi:hypothetical protein
MVGPKPRAGALGFLMTPPWGEWRTMPILGLGHRPQRFMESALFETDLLTALEP